MAKKTVLAIGLMWTGLMWTGTAWAQPAAVPAPVAAAVHAAPTGWPGDSGTVRELNELLSHTPPNLRKTLQLDPSLLNNAAYLAPYPALAVFAAQHPEIGHNPSYYLGDPEPRQQPPDPNVELTNSWGRMLSDTLGAVAGMLAMSLIAWLLWSQIQSVRWRNAVKAQAEAHAKLLDRLTNNEDLLAYINSPAGARFLQSAPVTVDASPRPVSAPLGRILWTVQGGVVLVAVGIGLEIVSRQSSYPVQQPLHALGILATALGIGFVVSAIISFMISHRLGLIEHHRVQPEKG